MNIVEQLRESRLFRRVKPEDLEALVQIMKRFDFPDGHVIFEKGDPGDALYIVLSGQVRIYTRDEHGNEITLSHLEPSRIFGEFALLDQQPRSASAATIGAVSVLALRCEDFNAFLTQHASVGLAMIENLVQQVRQVTSYLTRVNESLDLLANGEYERALGQITESSADAEIQRLTGALIEMVQTVRARSAPPNTASPQDAPPV